ncbi:hypothetical protein [Paraburkholderia caledonica]|uniref:Uncharacterized protein n=1 Tax=Paraburkholderia caledonica TaxID=134536 RepID=A0AB73IS17_9BURK|nr:hypothetical protein [Paraburkholderia caledonica]
MSDLSDEPTLGRRLGENGWKQGAIAEAEAQEIIATVLAGQGRHDLADALRTAKACAVAISQTCDIVCRNDAAEPFLEFVVAEIRDGAPNPQDTFLKSFRRFAAPLTMSNRHLVFRPWDKCLIPRAALANCGIATDVALEPRARDDLLDWLTTRYVRAALPDAFNSRLQVAGAEEKVRKALTEAPKVTEVYLLLKPRYEELTDPLVPYECDVVLLCERENYLDENVRKTIQPTLEEIERILAATPGIEVEDIHLRGEHEFSLYETRAYDRWQFDDLSYAAEYRAAKKGTVPEFEYRAGLSRSREGKPA